MTINYLFVYGTLKPGSEAYYYLARIHGIWSDAYCYGNWIKHTNIGNPVISLDTNGVKIEGKLFYSKQLQNIIKEIDEYEGEEYERVITKIHPNNGPPVKAFIYEKKR